MMSCVLLNENIPHDEKVSLLSSSNFMKKFFYLNEIILLLKNCTNDFNRFEIIQCIVEKTSIETLLLLPDHFEKDASRVLLAGLIVRQLQRSKKTITKDQVQSFVENINNSKYKSIIEQLFLEPEVFSQRRVVETFSSNETMIAGTCVICLDANTTYMCVPCAHLCLCEVCCELDLHKKCPVCRVPYEGVKRIYSV